MSKDEAQRRIRHLVMHGTDEKIEQLTLLLQIARELQYPTSAIAALLFQRGLQWLGFAVVPGVPGALREAMPGARNTNLSGSV